MRRLIIFCALILTSCGFHGKPVVMAGIILDATSSATSGGGSASSLTWSHTCAGSDRFLVVGVSIGSSSGTVSSLTYNSVNLTQLATVLSGSVRLDFWYLKAPATGANNIVVTLTTSKPVVAIGMSYTGVDQTTSLGTHATASGNSTAPSVSVSSATDELVVDVVHHRVTSTTLTVDASQTERVRAQQDGSRPTRIAGSTEAGAGSVTMSWTLSAAQKWIDIAVPMKAAAAPAGGTKTGQVIVIND